MIDADDIVIDAKSGVTGAGREAKQGSLYAEVAEGIHAYGVASHRHAPEIEQGLSAAAGREILVNFTPHLMPMNRGILATIYVRLTKGATLDGKNSSASRPRGGCPRRATRGARISASSASRRTASRDAPSSSRPSTISSRAPRARPCRT
jgi:hypothetical protein